MHVEMATTGYSIKEEIAQSGTCLCSQAVHSTSLQLYFTSFPTAHQASTCNDIW